MTPIINIKSNNNMVKSYFGLIVLICVVLTTSIFALGFRKGQPEEKKYKLEVTLNEANALLYCLDKSSAEHPTVMTLISLVRGQVEAQIKTEDSLYKLKAKVDSTNKKPKE